MISSNYQLIKNDIKRWGKNTLTFLAPTLLVFLIAIQSGVPVKDALVTVYLWGLNVAIDLLRKYIAITKY